MTKQFAMLGRGCIPKIRLLFSEETTQDNGRAHEESIAAYTNRGGDGFEAS